MDPLIVFGIATFLVIIGLVLWKLKTVFPECVEFCNSLVENNLENGDVYGADKVFKKGEKVMESIQNGGFCLILLGIVLLGYCLYAVS